MRAAEDAIAAVATPPGFGGVGIVRISGGDLSAIVRGIISPPPLRPRMASFRKFLDGEGGAIDEGLCLHFPPPNSFTGQEVLELHGHGGGAVMRALLSRCFELGARLAEPGEFTLRAHLNGRMDLSQAEAVADLINANTAAAARAAAQSMGGALSRRAKSLSDSIVALRAEMEAGMDFADEDLGAADSFAGRLDEARRDAEDFLEQCERGAKLAGGMSAAIVGEVNTGKSSLLNRLCEEDAAIVSAAPGATRDLIVRDIAINGMAVRLTDTAGLRAAPGEIEKEGVARAVRAAREADIILWVADNDREESAAALARCLNLQDGQDSQTDAMLPDDFNPAMVLRVRNKIDLSAHRPGCREGTAYVSAKTGAGIGELRAAIANIGGIGESPPPFSARERHAAALRECVRHLQSAQAAAGELEIAAAWLSEARASLASFAGNSDDEQLLAEIFSRFCVGK